MQGINRISDSMSKIAAGNFEITVNEQGNPEFKMLSDSINKMVKGFVRISKKNEQLIEKQNQDMEQKSAFDSKCKKMTCMELNQVSGETFS